MTQIHLKVLDENANSKYACNQKVTPNLEYMKVTINVDDLTCKNCKRILQRSLNGK